MTHNASMIAAPRRMVTLRRIATAGVLIALVLVGVRLASAQSHALPAPVDPLLPDLVMGPIEEITGGLEEFSGNPVVRVEATIVNAGAGDFIVLARRDFPWSEHWTVYQRFTERAGGTSERVTAADLIFTGVPHSHWHVLNMESHRLERQDTSEILSEVIKQGFCPFDTDLYHGDLPGAPATPVYLESACEGPTWVTSLSMGVSVGWGDKYPWHMVEQSIDITSVPDGPYRVREIADPFDWFEETDETNNETWVDIDIKRESGIPVVTVIGRAP